MAAGGPGLSLAEVLQSQGELDIGEAGGATCACGNALEWMIQDKEKASSIEMSQCPHGKLGQKCSSCKVNLFQPEANNNKVARENLELPTKYQIFCFLKICFLLAQLEDHIIKPKPGALETINCKAHPYNWNRRQQRSS
jgi:hypothetical protein